MKKKIKPIVLLSSVVLLLSYSNVSAAAFEENFQTGFTTGALNGQQGWFSSGTGVQITDDAGDFYVIASGSNTPAYLNAYTLGSGTTGLIYEARMFLQANEGSLAGIASYDGALGPVDAILQFGANGSGSAFRFRQDDNTSFTATTGDANDLSGVAAWYDVSITMDLSDLATATADVEVQRDGVAFSSLVFDDIAIDLVDTSPSGLSRINGLFVRPGNDGGASSRIDDLQVTVIPEPGTYAIFAGFLGLGIAMSFRRRR